MPEFPMITELNTVDGLVVVETVHDGGEYVTRVYAGHELIMTTLVALTPENAELDHEAAVEHILEVSPEVEEEEDD